MMRMMPPAAMAAAEGEDRSRSGWRQYLDALEEERRKIQVFQRELPLCLELLTQTIESYRQQMQIMSCGGTETEQYHRPGAVLEEFIPMKCTDASRSSSHEAERDNLRIVSRSTNGAEEMGACSIDQQKIGQEEEVGSDNGLMPTADWLNLAHLWHCTTGNNLKEVCMQDPPPYQEQHQTTPTKPIVVEARRPTGAFQPFCRSKPATVTAAPAVPAAVAAPPIVVPSPTPPEKSPQQPAAVAESSTTDAARSGEGSGPATTAESSGHASGTGEQEQKKVEVSHTQSSSGTSSNHRKSRRCWSPELHRRFLNALQQLGGSHVATPKQIRELMKVDGLTNDEVKSHLQKYRLHTRRPTSAVAPVSAATPHAAPHFVLVSGIWLPPAEYTVAAAVAAPQPAPAPDGRHSGGAPTTGCSASTKPPSQPVQGCQKQVGRPAAASTMARSAPQPHGKASTGDDADKGVDNSSSPATSSTSSRTGTTASPSAR